jgi:hypothetical protein
MMIPLQIVVCSLKLVNNFPRSKVSPLMNSLGSLNSLVVNTLGSPETPVVKYTRESQLPCDEYTWE